jgi:hypothetical protein
MSLRLLRVSCAACLVLLLGCSDDEAGGGRGDGGTTNGGTSSGHAGSGSLNQGGSASDAGHAGQLAGASSGGRVGSGGMTGAAGTSANDPYGDARARCVERTNELRASKGLAPIPRLASAESCADGQAKSDSESGDPHGSFDDCLDQVQWSGAAQNECPGYDSVEDALGSCLDAMWAEGPGGGHYDNMVGDATHTACGLYMTPDGDVWLVQDFWTE